MLDPDERVVVYVRDPFDKDELGLSDAFQVRASALSPPRHALGAPRARPPLARDGRPLLPELHRAAPLPRDARRRDAQRQRGRGRHASVVVPPHVSPAEQVLRSTMPTQSSFHRHDQAARDRSLRRRPGRSRSCPKGRRDSFAPVRTSRSLSETSRRYLGDDEPYVLFVGKQSQRRNIPALIEAFARVKRSDGMPHKLLLFGPNVRDPARRARRTFRHRGQRRADRREDRATRGDPSHLQRRGCVRPSDGRRGVFADHRRGHGMWAARDHGRSRSRRRDRRRRGHHRRRSDAGSARGRDSSHAHGSRRCAQNWARSRSSGRELFRPRRTAQGTLDVMRRVGTS